MKKKYEKEQTRAKAIIQFPCCSYSEQGIIQKKSVSGSRALPFVIFDKSALFAKTFLSLGSNKCKFYMHIYSCMCYLRFVEK